MSAIIERVLGEPMPSDRVQAAVEVADAAASDGDLWLRCHGDGPDAERAFTELFERHVTAIWNFAYRLTGSAAQAEDLAANTFLIAWSKRRSVRLEQLSARPWLCTVTANLSRTETRRLGRFRRALQRLPEPLSHPDHSESVVHDVDSGRRAATIAAAVAELPKAERQAVELCLLGELTTAEAATALGIADVSVRSRLSRARAKLRVSLEVLDR